MQLEVYVNSWQIGDLGRSLRVDDTLLVSLVVSPGSTMGYVLALECYTASVGRKTLVRTGLAEYAFSGQILDAKKKPMRFSELSYQEALVDCGVPILFRTDGWPGFAPILDLEDPTKKELQKGRYLSGLGSLGAEISFRLADPPLIEKDLSARVIAIAELDTSPGASAFAIPRPVKSIDPYRQRLPILLSIEIP